MIVDIQPVSLRNERFKRFQRKPSTQKRSLSRTSFQSNQSYIKKPLQPNNENQEFKGCLKCVALQKHIENLQLTTKKLTTQKQYLEKQIQFMERIAYSSQTKNLQSYRQNYLELQIQQLQLKLKKSKSSQEQSLEAIIQQLKAQKYSLQAEYKALRLEHECRMKKVDGGSIREMILCSDEYTSLRQKYICFLEEYKELKQEYWRMKEKNDSSLFSVSDLSLQV